MAAMRAARAMASIWRARAMPPHVLSLMLRPWAARWVAMSNADSGPSTPWLASTGTRLSSLTWRRAFKSPAGVGCSSISILPASTRATSSAWRTS